MLRFRAAVALTVLGVYASMASAQFGLPFSDAFPLNGNAIKDTSWDGNVQLVHAGNQVWLAVWASTNTLNGTIGTDVDIFYARSEDDGLTWSQPQVLNTDAATDGSRADDLPTLGCDEFGKCVVVWQTTEDPPFGYSDLATAYSSDSGITWSAPSVLNSNAGLPDVHDVLPRIAYGAGTWSTVWGSGRLPGENGPDIDVLFAKSVDGGQTWSNATPIDSASDRDVADDKHAAIATDGQGNWIALWWRHTPSNIAGDYSGAFFSRSIDDATTWSAPEELGEYLGSAGTPMTEITHCNGIWLATWRPSGAILFSKSSNGGVAWTDPAIAVDNGLSIILNHRCACDSYGNWVLVWEDWEGPDRNVLTSRFWNGSAAWTTPQVAYNLESELVDTQAPGIAVGNPGHWQIAWHATGPTEPPTGNDADIFSTTFHLGDCNLNSVADLEEIKAGQSADCDSNAVPDECQTDCDRDGIADACEIISGAEADCNGNFIIDDCDIANSVSPDCDLNGIPDECQSDCDGNGTPDACESVLADCNLNLVDDLCDLSSAQFAIDDGVADTLLGLSSQAAMIWANHFDAGEGMTISSIAVAFGAAGQAPLKVGDPVTLVIWDDPNGDGLPDDAIPLVVHDATVIVIAEFGDTVTEVLSQYAFDSVFVTGSFFAGAMVGPHTYPAAFDQVLTPMGECWYNEGTNPLDLQGAADVNEFQNGRWMIRVNTNDVNNNGIPDDCDEDGNPADIAPPGGDGVVGPADLGELLAQWGACPPPEQGPCTADIAPPSGGDGVVGPADLAELLANWTS